MVSSGDVVSQHVRGAVKEAKTSKFGKSSLFFRKGFIDNSIRWLLCAILAVAILALGVGGPQLRECQTYGNQWRPLTVKLSRRSCMMRVLSL